MVGDEKMDLIDKNSTILLFDYLTSNKIINSSKDYILELAAGNGRITESVLCKLFNNIDVLEQSKNLALNLKKIKFKNVNIKTILINNVQSFYFERKYDVIFARWLFGNLTDSDALSFLLKCKLNLAKNGVIIIKDNINEKKQFILEN